MNKSLLSDEEILKEGPGCVTLWDGEDIVDFAHEIEKLVLKKLGYFTKDGRIVKTGDNVWVNGSVEICKTTVSLPSTNYYLFGPVPVSQSFSTKQNAEKARYD